MRISIPVQHILIISLNVKSLGIHTLQKISMVIGRVIFISSLLTFLFQLTLQIIFIIIQFIIDLFKSI